MRDEFFPLELFDTLADYVIIKIGNRRGKMNKKSFFLDSTQKEKVEKIAQKNNLKFVILYGSQARQRSRPDSDLDLAILGEKEIGFKEILLLFNQFSELFSGQELDVKSLHHIDALFRYLVVRDGILLYGNKTDYLEFKAYAFRDYTESASLFRLQEIHNQKRLKKLKAVYG